jgi:hypothetical protein
MHIVLNYSKRILRINNNITVYNIKFKVRKIVPHCLPISLNNIGRREISESGSLFANEL